MYIVIFTENGRVDQELFLTRRQAFDRYMETMFQCGISHAEFWQVEVKATCLGFYDTREACYAHVI